MNKTFFVGPMEIMAFPTLHDANEPCGFLTELGASRFALATDTGTVRDSWLKHVLEADAVMLESNYDPDMLAAGSYPYALKQRISGTHGHLSNDNAADAALKLVEHGTKRILLSHLSRENNFPQLAHQSVKLFLEMHGVNVDNDEDVALSVARRDGPTGVFGIASDWD
jgi:Metal-dependent hydrolases of the beta-lactamase superfamily I